MTTEFVRKRDVVTRRVAGELILVPVSGSVVGLESIYTLNEVGGAIWSLLDGRSVDAIADTISGEFDVPPEAAREDVAEFLRDLEASGLIEARP